jgi:hypothetical protein
VAFVLVVAVLVAACLSGCKPAVAPPPPPPPLPAAPPGIQFVRIAPRPIGFLPNSGRDARLATILETLGTGAAILDFDGDYFPDVALAGGGEIGTDRSIRGRPSGLFRRTPTGDYHDCSRPAGLDAVGHYTHGVFSADWNDDGFDDLLITGYGGLALWVNQGDGTFQPGATPAGLADDSWSTGAAWADLNGDGFLDLYVAHYVDWSFENHFPIRGPEAREADVCSPKKFEPLADTLYMNNGDGTFTDASGPAGLRPDGKGLGVLAGDVDLDGDVDLYVANDTTENFLYINDGRGKLSEVGLIRGVAVDQMGLANGSMGVELADVDLDGWPDLWVANYDRELLALYRNVGNGAFLHVSQSAGIAAIGNRYVSWGMAARDFDRDGDEDLVVSNGHVLHFPSGSPERQLPLVFESRQGRFFRLEYLAGFLAEPHHGRGLAAGDLDGDGDLDLVVSPNDEAVEVLSNESPWKGDYLAVRLIGRQANRSAIGARLTLKTTAGTQTRQVTGGGSYLSASDRAVFWGIPPGASVVEFSIRWPSGGEMTVKAPGARGPLMIVEPVSTVAP